MMQKHDINGLLAHRKHYYEKRLKESFPHYPIIFNKTHPVIIYGASIVGRAILSILLKQNIPVVAFVDKNKELRQKKIEGVPVISPYELRKKFFDKPIIIASVIYEKEIYEELLHEGYTHLYPLSYLNFLNPVVFNFRNYHERWESIFQDKNIKKIKKVYSLLAEEISRNIYYQIINFRLKHYFRVKMDDICIGSSPQYFENDIIHMSNDEIFLDGGAYTGDTLEIFYKIQKGIFDRIYAFEPDDTNMVKLKRAIVKYPKGKIIPVQKGLYYGTGTVAFYALGTPESSIETKMQFSSFSPIPSNQYMKNLTRLPVAAIDDFFKDKKPPTFIKMDIEGAEQDALKGAKAIIKKYKPKLAICIYHTPADLWEIPLMIHQLNNNYKLHIRHYSRELCETVCYAT